MTDPIEKPSAIAEKWADWWFENALGLEADCLSMATENKRQKLIKAIQSAMDEAVEASNAEGEARR